MVIIIIHNPLLTNASFILFVLISSLKLSNYENADEPDFPVGQHDYGCFILESWETVGEKHKHAGVLLPDDDGQSVNCL